MLRKCKRALLLSDVASFVGMYSQLADEAEVELTVESVWSDRYRITQDVVILGAKYLDNINKIYYDSVVLILKSGESPYPYIKMGISRFIFDHTNQFELYTAFFKEEPVYVNDANKELKDLVKDYNSSKFCYDRYDFNFLTDTFTYKGKPIYLTKAQKRYLAEWLLHGRKDNSKRMFLFSLRKKFGEDFLTEVDRHGQIKEEKDE